MAKGEDEFDLDFGDLDNFDFGDPFGEAGTPKDDRSPSTQFVGGFLKGVQETAKKPSTYVDFMRKALPEGYSSAYSVLEDATGKGLGLYNEVVTDLRPAMRDLKRIMYRAKTAVDSVLPDSLSKKLDGWLKEKERENDYRGISPEQANDLKIATDIAEIFKVQAEAKAEDDNQDLLSQVVESKRHRTQTEQLDEIRLSLKQLTNYQDKITYAYQRKSLELQYRQYFAQRDLLEVTKAGTQESVTILRGILKNSALPDIQKEFLSETASRLTKERLYGAVQDRIAPFAREFLGPFFENLSKRIKEKTSEFADMVSMVAMGSDAMAEAGEMAEDFGQSKSQMAGNESGKLAAGFIARWLGGKLRPHLEKRPDIVAGGYKAGYLADNYDLLLREKLEDWMPNNPFMQMLQESAMEALRVRKGTEVGYDDIANATKRVSWDNLQRKTLVEIIPGYLAKLLQSSESHRTGKAVPLSTYDHKTNRFTTVAGLAQSIRTRAVDQYNLDRLSSRTTEVIDKIDPTKSILDEESRKAFQLYLIKQAQKNKGFTPKSFSDESELMAGGLSFELADKIANAVRTSLDMDFEGKAAFTPEAQKLQAEVATQIRSLRELIPSVYEFANLNANTANRDAVRASGLVRTVGDKDHVDDRFLIEKMQRYLNGVPDEIASPEVSDDSAGLPTVSGSGRRTRTTRRDTDDLLEHFKTAQSNHIELLQHLRATSQNQAEKIDLRSDFDRLIAVVREESTKQTALDASTTLREILDLVDAIKQEGVASYQGELPEPDSPDAKKWRITRKIGRGLYGAGSTLFKPVKGLWNLGGKLSGGAMGALSSSWAATKNVGSALFDPLKQKFKDIYVPGYAEAKLRADLMRAGEYLDAKTGKVIESLRDIKGAVVDKAGNVVLSAEDIKKGLMTADGKPIGARLLSGLSSTFFKGAGFITRELGKGFTLPFSISAQAFTKLRNLGRTSPDVYVLGEGTPRIKGSLLRAGHYISAKTRKAIYSVDEIDSDVLDSVTGEVILSASDAAKGLVDRFGKPIRTLFGKAKDVIKKGFGLGIDALKWGGDQLMKGFGTVKDILTGSLRGLGNLAKGVHIGGVKMDPVVSSVDRIYELLVKYFATRGLSEQDIEASGVFDADTGDVDLREKPKSILDRVKEKSEALKDRAGSWFNLKNRERKEKPEKVTKEKAEKPEKQGGGWLSTISLLLGSLGGSVVSAIKWLGGIIAGKAALGAAGDLLDVGLPDSGDGKEKGRRGRKGRGSRVPTPAQAGAKKGLMRRAVGGLAKGAWLGIKGAGRAALFLGGTALKVGGALMSLATVPVILGVGAAALVGYTGYRVYRYYKDKLAPLQRVRLSQYGLILDDVERRTIVGQLEMDALKHVIWTDGKASNIDSRFDLISQLERFGIDPSNRRDVDNFANWYQNRFKPVYLTHLTVLSKLQSGLELHRSDELPDYLKVTYVKASRYNADTPPQPYNVNTSPFPGQKLVEGREIIENEIQKVIDEFKDAKRPERKASEQSVSKRPKIVPQALPKAGNALGAGSPTKRTEFVTQAAPMSSPVGSMIAGALPKTPSVASAVPKRDNFVTALSAEETAYDLSQRPDANVVGDQPKTDLYSKLPDPQGNGSWEAIKNTLMAAAAAMGIDVRKLAMLAKLESSFDIYAKAKTSSAKGLFQFISSTWRGLMDKYAGKFGIPRDAQPTDPKAASILAAQFMKINDDTLKKALGKTPDLTESYLAHFLGAGGSKTFLAADRTALAKDVLPKAASANRSIFFNRDQSPRTVGEVIEVMRNKVEGASNTVAKVPTTVSSSSGAVASVVEEGTFDDGRANRSAAIPKAPSNSLLIPALPTQPTLPANTTTSGITEPSKPTTVTPLEFERKEFIKQETRNKQLEQQQASVALSQREDMLAAIDLASRSLKVQESMDASLKRAIIHLANLEKLASAEKPEVKVTETKSTTLAATPVAPAPVAALSTQRRYT